MEEEDNMIIEKYQGHIEAQMQNLNQDQRAMEGGNY
jgi:hypothetical protein